MNPVDNTIFNGAYVDPYKEMVAWEALWSKIERPTFKKVSQKLNSSLPTNLFGFINRDEIIHYSNELENYDLKSFNTLIAGTSPYPEDLHRLQNYLPVIYYKGDIGLLELDSISIVGSRKVSDKGIEIAKEFASGAVHNGLVVVSGLAYGVDTAAHKAAIKSDGRTIGIIGTPINEAYPKENKHLQEEIEKNHLLISHVPFLRYAENKKNNFRMNPRIFFPERNKTMAALTKATVIIEASDTSGTLIQARECLRMGRKLIIHSRLLENKELKWPRTYEERDNVFVCDSFDQVLQLLSEK